MSDELKDLYQDYLSDEAGWGDSGHRISRKDFEIVFEYFNRTRPEAVKGVVEALEAFAKAAEYGEKYIQGFDLNDAMTWNYARAVQLSAEQTGWMPWGKAISALKAYKIHIGE